MYIRNAETMIIVAVYVDDLIVIAETEEEMKKVKQSLSAQFKMKDMNKTVNRSVYECIRSSTF